MICLDKTKTNRCDQKKDEDNTFFLLAFSWRPCCSAKKRQRRIQNFKRHHLLYFCYSFLYYCTTNLIFDRHVISILGLRYVLHEHVFCLQCFVIKFYPIAVRCLKDTSWKVVTDQIAFTAISCKIST